MNAINSYNYPSPLGEGRERAALRGEGQAVPAPARPFRLDTGLLAVGVGLSLWFVCAAMVISTFVAPGLLGR